MHMEAKEVCSVPSSITFQRFILKQVLSLSGEQVSLLPVSPASAMVIGMNEDDFKWVMGQALLPMEPSPHHSLERF